MITFTLPPCICCGATSWQPNESTAGMETTRFFSCRTLDCNGRAYEVFCALGLLVLFEAPMVDGNYRLPAEASLWIHRARKRLAAADLGGCIYAGAEPPATLVLPPVPTQGRLAFYTALDLHAWTRAEPGASVDLGPLFRARVEQGREADRRAS